MRKKIVSLLLAVCLVCGLIGTVGPVAYAEAEEIKGLCGVGLHYVINLSQPGTTCESTRVYYRHTVRNIELGNFRAPTERACSNFC